MFLLDCWRQFHNNKLLVSKTTTVLEHEQLNTSIDTSHIPRATIDLEPKIRTAVENLILLPKNKAIGSVCTTNVRSFICLFISRTS